MIALRVLPHDPLPLLALLALYFATLGPVLLYLLGILGVALWRLLRRMPDPWAEACAWPFSLLAWDDPADPDPLDPDSAGMDQ